MPAPRHTIHSRGLTLLETVIALTLIAALLDSPAGIVVGPAGGASRSVRRSLARRGRGVADLPGRSQPAVSTGAAAAGLAVRRDADFACRWRGVSGFSVPLTQYLNLRRTTNFDEAEVYCPADRGISGVSEAAGTARRAFESYGTSYRAKRRSWTCA